MLQCILSVPLRSEQEHNETLHKNQVLLATDVLAISAHNW